MIKKHLLTLTFFFCALSLGLSQATVSGKVMDEKGPASFAVVVLLKGGVQKGFAETDDNGIYRFSSVDAGTYDLAVSLTGNKPYRQEGIVGNGGKGIVVDIQLESSTSSDLKTVTIKSYKVPIVSVDNTTQGGTLTSEQISKMPVKDLNGLAALTAGAQSSPDGGAFNVKGSRENSNRYYIDGILTRSANVPSSDIDQLQVITGGMEAKYGDVTGGVISVTTKGPANKFTGGFEVETSKGLDPYGYLLGSFNLAGPIISKTDKVSKTKESVLGFRLSGQFTHKDDNSPPATPYFKIKEDARAKIEADPVFYIGTVAYPSAAKLQAGDFDQFNVRQNNKYDNLDLNGKLDLRLSKNVDLTLGGGYHKDADQFSPSTTAFGVGGPNWNVFNSQVNPFDNNTQIRTNFRIRHKLIGSAAEVKGAKKSASTVIENASYTIQAGYEINTNNRQDEVHKDKFFEYGYVGQFKTDYIPSGWDTLAGSPLVVNTAYTPIFKGYTPNSTYNPILTNYNKGADVASEANFPVQNGFMQDGVKSVWGYHQNIGTVYNTYLKTIRNISQGSVTFNFDLVPGGDRKAAHNIQAGFSYEQRSNSSYNLSPFGLWKLAADLQNGQINGIDYAAVGKDTIINGKAAKYYPVKVNLTNAPDYQFWRKLRESQGQKLATYGNSNYLTPDKLSLDMFSAGELADRNLVSYSGYDYLGNQVSSKVAFADFWTATNTEGVRTFPVASFDPIYMAGYIQDKFRYKDLIVRVGLRLDRYDANTKVLKDPYSLYEIQNAKDFYSTSGKPQPSNIGDNYKVYVDGSGKSAVAYRQGDTWYDKEGSPKDPKLIFSGAATPKYTVDNVVTTKGIKSRNFDPSGTFEDYTPQVSILPRLSFSFPISDAANFFAHYDILAQRPPSNTQVTALNYYYFLDPSRTTENNANLKPEKTIDYEVGFQQKLTEYSGIKIAAYYKELRDMIQLREYKFVSGGLESQYTSYGNLDFGTVKGFTFQYDLRRFKNITAMVNYTLQFADGTGSDPTSQRDFINVSNLRTLSPLSYDERHRISATIDYRYEGGKQYNGPSGLRGLLENMGIDLQFSTYSGHPYSPKVLPNPFDGSQLAGTINGANLPWVMYMDLRIDKTFSLSKNAKSPLDVNVYFRVQNLFDALNVASVYTATGSANNDGYLLSSNGKDAVRNASTLFQGSPEAYYNSYQMRMLDPGHYYQPRRIYVGASFQF
jgi:outer membrane receptor protein involved in Fe transport